jgi:dolichyl-phosphate-mannose--protein O-mannosyl transferase
VPSAALLLLTAYYAQIYRRKGFTFVALPSYLISYMLLGIVLDYWLTGWLKNFAPASPSEAQAARYHAVIWCIFSLLVATAGAVLASQDASRRRAMAG